MPDPAEVAEITAEERAPLPGPVKLVLAAFALVVLVFAKDGADSWADGSRLGTIQGLVEHGTLALDDTDFLWQGDKVWVGGHYFSQQPPMLALLGALPYAVLHHGLGLAITDGITYRVLTWTLVGLPLFLGLACLARLLLEAGAGPRTAALLLALAVFGTHVLPYSLVLQQHGASTGFLLLGFYAVARRRPEVAGALLALACTIDLTAVFPAVFLAWPVLRSTGVQGVVRYGLGALPVLGLHFGVNYALVGDLRPLGLHLEAFEYPYSSFLFMSLTGGEQRAGEQAAYLFGELLGKSGYLSHHPIVLPAIGAALVLAVRRSTRLPAGLLAAAGLSVLAIAAYYLTQSRNFGGSAFGMRWFTPFGPLLALFPAALIGARENEGEPIAFGPAARVATGLLAVWSIAAASLGSVQPWAQFAYFWHQRPDAPIANPALVPDSWPEHLKREWIRITTFEQAFDQDSYVAWYQDIIHRHGKLYTQEWPGEDQTAALEFTRSGLVKLQRAVDFLDQAEDRTFCRVAGHFWLGKLHQRLGDRAAAARAFDRTLGLAPSYGPALKARAKLDAE